MTWTSRLSPVSGFSAVTVKASKVVSRLSMPATNVALPKPPLPIRAFASTTASVSSPASACQTAASLA